MIWNSYQYETVKLLQTRRYTYSNKFKTIIINFVCVSYAWFYSASPCYHLTEKKYLEQFQQMNIQNKTKQNTHFPTFGI